MPESRLVLTVFLAASGLVAQTVETDSDPEQWDSQRILTALSGLQIFQEVECEAEGIASSAWAGLQDEIAELHNGPLSPYDGIVFPNFHYVQIEHIVARKEADESGPVYPR